MRTHRIFIVLIALASLLGTAAFAAESLPEIPGYSAGAVGHTPLSAPSGDFGTWVSRTYRTEGGRLLEVTLMSGPGAGPLVTGPEGTKTDDRPVGFGATYEVFAIDGRRAVFETLPSVGAALVVAIDENVTLTLESSSLPRNELEKAAMHIIRSRGNAPD